MVQWFRSTTKEFFNVTTDIKDNVQKVEFESGRIKTWLKSQSLKKTHSVSFKIGNKTVETRFWAWYEATLRNGALSVELPNLLTGTGTKEYLLTSNPKINGTHFPKIATINVIEV